MNLSPIDNVRSAKTPSHCGSGLDFDLEQTAVQGIEQGVWTAISYFCEHDAAGAIEVANVFDCSVNSVHEFDWDRFTGVYGSKSGFKKHYNKLSHSDVILRSSMDVVNLYLSQRPEFKGLLSNKDADKLHRYCIITGSSVALGEIHKIDELAAKEVSDIVGADIKFMTKKGERIELVELANKDL